MCFIQGYEERIKEKEEEKNETRNNTKYNIIKGTSTS